MVVVNINGIDVIFPFEPYEIQKNYMSKVIECLSTENNGILESPTGTGKTLSLLCSTLAWLEAKKAQLQLERGMLENQDDDFLKRLNEQLGMKSGRSGKSFLGVPTIIYASRTHTQLTQAVGEMKMTAYNHMKACVIGSREQMCIHPEVVREQNNQTKITMCNLKTKTRTCNFYNNLQKKKEDPQIRNINIVDIEDLVALGKSHRFCPYFMAKEFKSNSDIVFMPYNYLLEPRFRKTLGIELANNIIILDEAHNVEKMCEESASLQLKSTDIALAIEEVTTIMKMLTEQPAVFDDENTSRDFSADDLIILKQILLDLEKELDAITLSKNPEGTTFGGNFIFELLTKAGIKQENHQIIIVLLEKLVEFLSVAAEDGPFKRRGNALKLIEDALRVIFLDNSAQYKQRVDKCYKVHIIVEEPKKKENNSWFSKKSKDSCRVLSYWCFSPGFGMKMLLDEGVRCCILTSGTLAPLKPLITELEFQNPVHLENPHVVQDTQLCVRIISNGPDNERLTCSFQNRDNENYLRSLGYTIMNMTRLIPNGLLIFFPSYPIMNKCMEYWQNHGIWSSITNLKSIYTEPRDKVSFSNAMTEYYDKIRDPTAKGAIFMGVCRGKISEGLDFADLNGRGVIIVGLPFPPLKDPRVILKKRYLDNCRSTNQEYIGGDKWYTLEACRAVNQAIGRVIRHRNDYGAILLLDERFKNPNIQSQLSSWLRDRIKIVQNFGEITRDLRLFYKHASEKFPLCNNKKATAGLPKELRSETQQSHSFSNAYNCFQFSSDGSSSNQQSSSNSLGESSSSTSSMLEGYRKRVGAQIGGIAKKMKIRLVPNPTVENTKEEENEAVSESTKEYIAMGVEKYVDKDQKEEFRIFWEQSR
ncbi:regulator of telomere elongation helicase 1 homolog isoform X2 [Coccinella septempunctata]|uniref:regulator of telomere elongation helicase 1 homolog isoform X2 n=1 Tax=Coccinella septempunctata TaxID=41139 RepID=UPI001D088878|nr:regulator of telomere elongation helicase 1 homolog isoform X2 [Coccinella septempunctata]